MTSSLEVILQFMLLMGAMIFVGMQITSIATNGLLSNEEKVCDLNYVTKTLSYTMVVLFFIFSIDTYAISWSVSPLLQRQLMIFSSMFIIMWILGLVLSIEKKSRLLSTSFLLIGSITATWTWFLMSDALFFLFGCTLITGLILLILLAINGDSASQLSQDDNIGLMNSPEAEQLIP
jgi:hypothetical protein